jgi:serine/threonine-protein kinase
VTQPTLRGKYRTTRLLGEGGMGSVFEAEDTTTGARIALKVMRPEIAKSTVFMARFEREVRASQAIRTPYIVEVLDAGTDERSGEPFMAMELLEGEDLKHVLKRTGPLHPVVALKIVAQACLGLHAAHEQRIVHRDIKSANIFLTQRPGGERIVKLLDFGIAKEKLDKEIHAETAGLTRTGNMLGSPLYMSPEQVRGHKSIDHRADLWSLGIVLYEALAGRTPHQDAETLGELIITICSELPRPVQELAPWVPPSIAAILSGAIRFDPAERFPSAAAMFEAIKPLLQGDLTITEEMLRPLSNEERSFVAPRLQEAMPQGRQSMQAMMFRLSVGHAASPAAVSFRPAGVPPARRALALVAERSQRPVERRDLRHHVQPHVGVGPQRAGSELEAQAIARDAAPRRRHRALALRRRLRRLQIARPGRRAHRAPGQRKPEGRLARDHPRERDRRRRWPGGEARERARRDQGLARQHAHRSRDRGRH